MFTIEMDLARAINNGRQKISKIDAQLRALNEAFPDQKRLPDSEKDPEFLARRSALLPERRFLSGIQHGNKNDLSRRIRPVILRP